MFNDIRWPTNSRWAPAAPDIKTSTARRVLLTAALVLVSVIFTISFFKNNSLENRVRDAARVTASADVTGGELASLDALRKLETLRESLATLVEYGETGLAWATGSDDIATTFKVARPIYCGRFRVLLTQTQANILQDMRNLPGRDLS